MIGNFFKISTLIQNERIKNTFSPPQRTEVTEFPANYSNFKISFHLKMKIYLVPR